MSEEKELVFQRSGEGAFNNANNNVSVTATRLDETVEFGLIIPVWNGAPTERFTARVEREIRDRLAFERVYPLREDGVEFVDPRQSDTRECVLIRVEARAARRADPSLIVKFDEVTMIRFGRPKSGEFKVLLPADSALRNYGPHTYGELLDQMARRHQETDAYVAMVIASEVAPIINRHINR